jgi:hypothetical protein
VSTRISIETGSTGQYGRLPGIPTWVVGVVSVKSRCFAAFLAAAIAAGCGNSGGSGAAAATQGEPFEIALQRVVGESNPFDPDLIRVDAEVASPSGDVFTTPAFVTRAYERALVGGFEKLDPVGELQWRIRFTPTQPGRWQWRWHVDSADGEEIGEWNEVDVAPASSDFHGFVRRSARDPRYLEFDDGAPFFAVGENMCWYDGRGTFAYDVWIPRLAEQGGNYIRLWMPSWAFGLEWITRGADGSVVSSSLGNYEERLDRAWQLDHVIELARRHRIQVMLSIQNHGAFSLTNNSEWVDSPYNAANGGPLATPKELFTDAEAIRLFKQRLRYIVGRWGYASNIMTWELWNEVDLVEQPGGTAVADWHAQMAAELRALDPYDRLISTSTSLGDALAPGSPFGVLWELDNIDYTQSHFYSFGGIGADFTQIFPRIGRRLLRFGKPVFISEAGVDFRGPAETIAADPDADGFHDILWAAIFSETFGIGMSWWWDNVVDPLDLYFHFGPLAQFTEGVDFAGEAFVAETIDFSAPDGRPLRAFMLRGETTVLVWIKNMQHQWTSPDNEPVNGAVLILNGLGSGSWRATWLDTRSAQTSMGIHSADAAPLPIDIPTFTRDIALRLESGLGTSAATSGTAPRPLRW